MVHGVPWVLMGAFGFGSKHPVSLGLFGGYASASIPAVRRSGTNLVELMNDDPAAVPTTAEELIGSASISGELSFGSVSSPMQPCAAGDVLIVATGGGTGYGDVLERAPDAVMEDVRWGVTSRWAARELYHVVFDGETLAVDEAATEAARSAVRRQRLANARPVREFEQEWSRRRPDEFVTRFFGAWPDPLAAELPPAPLL